MRDRIEALFKAWGHFAYRRAWLVIPVMLALSGVVLTQASKIHIDTSTEGFFHADDPIRVQYNRFRDAYGRESLILVALVPRDGVFDRGFLERLRVLHRDVQDELPELPEATIRVDRPHHPRLGRPPRARSSGPS